MGLLSALKQIIKAGDFPLTMKWSKAHNIMHIIKMELKTFELLLPHGSQVQELQVMLLHARGGVAPVLSG